MSDIYMEAAAEVAKIAGAVALKYYGKNPEQRLKSDGSPVSAADIEAERAAREWIEKRFPDDGIVGEELPSVREGAARRWVLDPIDGTLTFLRAVPFWGTLVGVTEGDEVLAGAASFPALGESLAAAPGAGCWHNGTRCSVSSVGDVSQALVLTTDARFPGRAERQKCWLRLQVVAKTTRTWGDCYGYLLVATGRAEVMVDDVVSAWDAAALMPIITEAGGVFTDWKGNATPFGGDAIATNAALADEARNLLGARS